MSRVPFLVITLLVASTVAYAQPHRVLKQHNPGHSVLPPPPPPVCEPEWCEGAEDKDESVIRGPIEDENERVCTCVCDPILEQNRLLHVTACSEAVAFADLMIDYADPMCPVDITNAAGDTPLITAAGCCNTPMAFTFLSGGDQPKSKNKADPDAENDAAQTAICVAALTDDPDCAGIVNHVVDFGGDICIPCPNTGNPSDPIPYEVAVDKTVKDIIAQNGGQRKADGGTCPDIV